MGFNSDWSLFLAVVGTFVSLLGFSLSIIQTIRYHNSQRDLEQLRRARNANIWSNIGMILQAYESIDDARQLARGDRFDKEALYAKINSVRRTIVNHYLQLLKEAILDEEVFTEETVEDWKRIGRLENEWRVAQAMKFIQTGKKQERPLQRRRHPTA